MPLLARSIQTPLHIEVRRGAVADLGRILADGRVSAGGDVAVVVGPGLGRDADARERLGAAMAVDKPLVLDGDALWLLAEMGSPAVRKAPSSDAICSARAASVANGRRIASGVPETPPSSQT